MRAVCYLRVSTDEQADSGAGLKAQLDACRAHAERAGRELVGPFADEGLSGAAGLDHRPGLMEAIGVIEPGDVLLVSKRDRLGRDPIVVAMIEAAATRRGARVVSAAGEGTDGDGPADVLMRRMVDAFAEYERLVIKARTKAALGAKRRRGERTGRVPFGYDLVDDGRRSKAGRPCALVASAAEQATIARIRAMSAGGMPPAAIAAELQLRGVPTKTGAPWSNMAVRRILARPEPTPAQCEDNHHADRTHRQ
jgi:DNA invertase Pin-like site-specific DNA recombinase